MTIALSMSGWRAAAWSGRGAVTAAAALLAFAVTAFAPQVLNDGDTFLHIAAGRRMLDDHAILFRDPFSYTFAGAPWEAHEWLAEIAMALAYAAGGWSGLLVLFAAAAAATVFVLADALGRWLEPRAQAAATVLAMSCMTASLLARPHLLALPLLAIWTAELVTARSRRRAPSLALLPVMAIWVNVHASFLLGFALAGGLALEALLEERSLRTLRSWGVFGMASLGAALINPHFAQGVVFPLTLMATPALAAIGEWQATPLTLFQPIVPVIAAALYVIATRRVRLSAVRAAMLVALAVLAFAHARHQIVFAVAAPLLLAEPLSRAFGKVREDRSRLSVALAMAGLLVLCGLRLALPVLRGDSPVAPQSALAAVPATLRAEPVLNDYAFGGYLIFSGVKPFIDSRAELYGEAALENYAALARPDALRATIRRYGIRWSILDASSPLVAELDAMPGWRRLHADRFAVVQFRDRTGDPAR
ncbi:MAG: hypothetical protein WDN01_18295 [Rhizomicrobium sp.]